MRLLFFNANFVENDGFLRIYKVVFLKVNFNNFLGV